MGSCKVSLQVTLVQGEVKTFMHSVYHGGLSKVGGTPQDAGPLSTETLSPTPGTVCDFRLSYGRVLSRSSKIIIVNRNRKEMLMNSDMFWKPQEAVQGELLAAPTHMCSFRSLSSWPLLQLA